MSATEASDRGPRTATDRWMRTALWLVAGTMAYNVIEAVFAVWSGVRASSVALVGFGLDSAIECVAAGVVLWRLRVQAKGASPEEIEAAEHRVHRLVGATFIALALYVVGQAGWTLWTRHPAEESLVGIGLAIASLVIMPLISWGKIVTAKRLKSRSLLAEAKETLACSWLSLTLLLGLAANALWGWWWADPIAALAMVPWLVKEAAEGLRGEADDDLEEDSSETAND